MKNFSSGLLTNHVIIPFGSDFSFQFAHVNYRFLDDLFAMIKKSYYGKNFRFKYSTADEYFRAIQDSKKKKGFDWPTFTGDFFPYHGIYPGSYWSGYYTSRPNFKRLIRDYTGAVHALDNLISAETIRNRTNAKKLEDI